MAAHFPTGMYDMLEEAETKGHAHIISWSDGGQSFKIHKPGDMIEILRKYFFQKKYKSFLRQLQAYGFARVTRGEKRGIVSHPLLVQGKRFLCLGMKRKVRKPIRDGLSQSSHSTHYTPVTHLSSVQSDKEFSSMIGAAPVNLQGLGRRASTGSMPMMPVTRQQMQNYAWPLLGQDSYSRSMPVVTSKLSQISNLSAYPPMEDFRGFQMPLPTMSNNDIFHEIMQESDSASKVSDVVDDIDDDICNYFTKSSDLVISNNDLLSIVPGGVISEDDDWLKGISYEGADIVLEPVKFAMTLPPDLEISGTGADISMAPMGEIVM